MNERIQELAIKAGGGPSKWYTDPDVLEHFADLIIMDCIEICREERSKYNKLRQSARDQTDFHMYAEGGHVCDSIHHQMRERFNMYRAPDQ